MSTEDEGGNASPRITRSDSETDPSAAVSSSPSSRPAPSVVVSLAKTKQMWTSDDPPEEDILDRFLKVKSYADNRIPSYDSKALNDA